MSAADERRRALLTAVLGFLLLESRQIRGFATALHGRRGLSALHAWLDTWRGIGLIVDGMERYGFRVSLKKFGNGEGAWVAQFERDGRTSAAGFGSGSTPWAAVQQAAWVAVKRAS